MDHSKGRYVTPDRTLPPDNSSPLEDFHSSNTSFVTERSLTPDLSPQIASSPLEGRTSQLKGSPSPDNSTSPDSPSSLPGKFLLQESSSPLQSSSYLKSSSPLSGSSPSHEYSSQSASRNASPTTDPDPPSVLSPPIPSSSQPDGTSSGKTKKKATVTPRTFTRFFTPRSSVGLGTKVGASRQILRDITSSASNRTIVSRKRSPKKPMVQMWNGDWVECKEINRKDRKRKALETPETTPDRSSPIKRTRVQSAEVLGRDDFNDRGMYFTDSDDEDSEEEEPPVEFPQPFFRSKYRGGSGAILRREQGAVPFVSRRLRYNCTNNWQCETSNFYSREEDIFLCKDLGIPPPRQPVPFCATPCNTNSLVAIGDGMGGLRLVESARGSNPGFSKAIVTFRPHKNAILDITFSSDDTLLATAAGDACAGVIDMETQRTIYTLIEHQCTIKQIRFQPGSNNVIGTSSRDGIVNIYDLRCRSSVLPVQEMKAILEDPKMKAEERWNTDPNEKWLHAINRIYPVQPAWADSEWAKARIQQKGSATSGKPSSGIVTSPKTKPTPRQAHISITALSFLPQGREHLLLTGSDNDATVKLWDLRMTYSHRWGCATPTSTTQPPDSHNKHRHFGLTSMGLSGDGGRLYTLCRDSTVYAYSTSHLILGHAPELSSYSNRANILRSPEKDGLGPLYGFRHPKLHCSTFYVKLAVRPARDDKTELLAVGSSDSCAVVFPTDERYMQHHISTPLKDSIPDRPIFSNTDRPFCSRRRRIVSVSKLNRPEDTIPMYLHGSALVEGHTREVTGLTWTQDGDLVTISDDWQARCWRDGDGTDARDLRTGGEGEGRRWSCGWAEVQDGDGENWQNKWDEED